MKIVVAARCRDEEQFMERFLGGYDFVDNYVISDGGSVDNSVKLLEKNSKVILHHFEEKENLGNGYWWNPDAPHMNFVINKALELEPDWLIFDDFDCWPNVHLRKNAREILSNSDRPQVNVFRLYMWGETEYFPLMNRHFDNDYRSIWAWKPKEVSISADTAKRHGTLIGYIDDPYPVQIPNCLLHYSWHPDTIDQKLAHYKAVGFEMNHPFDMKNAGTPAPLLEWVNG